jgi:hypothetical protein
MLALLRHMSYSVTQIFIDVRRQRTETVAGLHAPEVLRKKVSG